LIERVIIKWGVAYMNTHGVVLGRDTCPMSAFWVWGPKMSSAELACNVQRYED